MIYVYSFLFFKGITNVWLYCRYGTSFYIYVYFVLYNYTIVVFFCICHEKRAVYKFTVLFGIINYFCFFVESHKAVITIKFKFK